MKNNVKPKYLVITHMHKPRQPKMTHLKDYMSMEVNRVIDEQAEFVTSLKNRHIVNASVIIDLVNQKLVKNRFDEKTYEELYEHFYAAYKDRVDLFLKQ